MTIRTFYLAAALLGTLVSWLFLGAFFATNGPDIPLFLRALFANDPATGFSADVLISIPVFWLWSWRDARCHGATRWWLVAPASFCVGLPLARQLYLYLRERDCPPARPPRCRNPARYSLRTSGETGAVAHNSITPPPRSRRRHAFTAGGTEIY